MKPHFTGVCSTTRGSDKKFLLTDWETNGRLVKVVSALIRTLILFTIALKGRKFSFQAVDAEFPEF